MTYGVARGGSTAGGSYRNHPYHSLEEVTWQKGGWESRGSEPVPERRHHFSTERRAEQQQQSKCSCCIALSL